MKPGSPIAKGKLNVCQNVAKLHDTASFLPLWISLPISQAFVFVYNTSQRSRQPYLASKRTLCLFQTFFPVDYRQQLLLDLLEHWKTYSFIATIYVVLDYSLPTFPGIRRIWDSYHSLTTTENGLIVDSLNPGVSIYRIDFVWSSGWE